MHMAIIMLWSRILQSYKFIITICRYHKNVPCTNVFNLLSLTGQQQKNFLAISTETMYVFFRMLPTSNQQLSLSSVKFTLLSKYNNSCTLFSRAITEVQLPLPSHYSVWPLNSRLHLRHLKHKWWPMSASSWLYLLLTEELKFNIPLDMSRSFWRRSDQPISRLALRNNIKYNCEKQLQKTYNKHRLIQNEIYKK